MKKRDELIKRKTARAIGHATGILMAILVFLVVCVASWLVTCGIIKLITLCFALEFSWRVATGVWLVMGLIRTVLNHTITIKKK